MQPSAAMSPSGGNPALPFDNYTIATMQRRELVAADYNPRIINEQEKKRLRGVLKKHKMVMPPVWNRRTGRVVGGHQRLEALDVLNGGADFALQVAVIDVDETTEKEINVALNNPQAQGDWDIGKLESLLSDKTIDLTGAGFDAADVYQLFGDAPAAVQDDQLEELAERMRTLRETYRLNRGRDVDGSKSDDFYLVLVFVSPKERMEFLQAMGFEDNRYQNGLLLLEAMQRAGVPMPITAPSDTPANGQGPKTTAAAPPVDSSTAPASQRTAEK